MNLISKMMNIYEYRARRTTLRQLRSMSDKQLADCGISRTLLNDGIKAWPWKQTPEPYLPIRLDHLAELKPGRSESSYDVEPVTESNRASGNDESHDPRIDSNGEHGVHQRRVA